MSGLVIQKKIKRTLLLDYQIISFYNHVFSISLCSVFCLKTEHTYLNHKLVIMVLLSLLLSSSVQISLISEQRNLKFTFKHAHTYYLLLALRRYSN